MFGAYWGPAGAPATPAAQTSPVDPKRLQAVITTELATRRAELVAIDGRLAPLADLLDEFVTAGGKRLRPEFLWCGWMAAADDPATDDEPLLLVAVALELIQACALIHDDVIDRSESRRGKPSTHRAVAKAHAGAGLAGDPDHYGISAAVLLGDLALAWADDLFLAGAQNLGAVDRSAPVWRAMRTEVLGGQLLDLLTTASAVADPAQQAADAMRVNRFKTAAYTVERPLQLGAKLAGAAQDTVTALRAYGADIGVAFQLRDDLLGVFGDPAVTGKPAGDDLLEGKRTLLLATARSALQGDPALLAELDAGIGTAGGDPDRLAAIIAGSGAVEVVEQHIAELVNSGLTVLDRLDGTGRPVITAGARRRLGKLALAATARRS
jgi:geranylgeranyl diphosphate synthase type I